MSNCTTSISRVAPPDLYRLIQSGAPLEILDVRTPPEFAAAHVPGAQQLSLDALNPHAFLESRKNPKAPLYVICQSGARATRAIQHLQAAGLDAPILVEGGTQAWLDAGLPVLRGESRVLPLMRQVQITVGAVCALGSTLALTVDVRFAALPLLMGCGLLFAGLSGTCALALLLAKMPWNAGPNSNESATVSTKQESCCS